MNGVELPKKGITQSQLTEGMPSGYDGRVSTSSIICIVCIVEAFIRRVATFTGTAWTQDYLNVCVCPVAVVKLKAALRYLVWKPSYNIAIVEQGMKFS